VRGITFNHPAQTLGLRWLQLRNRQAAEAQDPDMWNNDHGRSDPTLNEFGGHKSSGKNMSLSPHSIKVVMREAWSGTPLTVLKEAFNISYRTAKRYKAGGSGKFKKVKGPGGRPTVITKEVEKEIWKCLACHAYDLTYRELSRMLGIKKTTIIRFLKGKLRIVGKSTRPYLTDAQKKARVKWAKQWKDNDWRVVIDIDEKWFYAINMRRKLKVPKHEGKKIKYRIKSKRYIPKVH
jgi:hypothetical protein